MFSVLDDGYPAAYTQTTDAGHLTELLETLNSERATLIVLNHPLWDFADIWSRPSASSNEVVFR